MEKKKVIKNILKEKHNRRRSRIPIPKKPVVENKRDKATETVDNTTAEKDTTPKSKKNKRKNKNIENNDINKDNMNDKLDKVQNILDGETLPEQKVKVVKKEKGLFERTSNSTILLTEDNKLMLTD